MDGIDPRKLTNAPAFPWTRSDCMTATRRNPACCCGAITSCFGVEADRRVYAVPDDTPLPPNAKLVKTTAFTDSYPFLQYQVFEIP